MAPSKRRGDGSRSRNPDVSRRRFIAAAGAAGVAALAGCGGDGDGTPDDGDTPGGTPGGGETPGDDGTATGSPAQDQVTLEWAASDEEASEQQAFNDALHQAGLSENVTVEFLTGGDVTEDRRNQYQQWLSAGRETPDLLRMDNGWTIPFIARDQILNLSEAMDDEFLTTVEEEYFDAPVATASSPEGGLYALPLWAGLPTMLYRKDLVEDAGYDPEGENWASEPMTWQDFSEIVADVKEQSDVEYGYVFQADSYEGLSCCNFNEFMTSWGGAYFGGEENLFGPVGDRPITVADSQVADSIRMVRTFIYGDSDEESLDDYAGQIAPEAVTNWTEQETSGAFGNGNAAFMRNWPFFVGQFGAEEEYGEDLGVMPIPYAVGADEAEYPGTGGTAGALGGWHVAVNPNTQHMDAALETVRAAASDEFNYAIFEILGQIPPKPALLESDRASEVETVGRYVDTFQVVGENAIPRPVTVVWPDQSQQVYQEINATYSQQKGPEAALSDLASAIEQIEQSV